MKQSIFFDLYGTLIDIHTDEVNESFWNRLAIETEKYKKFQPVALRKQYEALCKDLEKYKEEIELLDVFKALYEVDQDEAYEIAQTFRKLSTEYVRLYPRVEALLKQLNDSGYNIYLLSNAQESFTIPEMKKLKIYPYFKGIAISSMYGLKKPNPEFFLAACKTFGIDKPIMIGNDYECDIVPAKKLGWKTIFLETNLTPENQVQDKIIGFDVDKILQNIQQE